MKNTSKAIIVYDNYVSPPTYGDFLYVVLFAKFLILSGYKIKFYIVDSELRTDWSDLNKNEIDIFLNDQLIVAKELLSFSSSKVERLSWCDLSDKIIKEESNLLFKDRILNRMPIYNCFHLLNELLADKGRSFLNKFLFNYNDFLKFNKINKVSSPYIAVGCRYSLKWEKERNLTAEDFIKIHSLLSNQFPNHKLLIVSDHIGCDYFSEVAKKNDLTAIFSKEYSKSILGDATLILGSDFFYQLRGGGISVFAYFSNIPYHIIQPLTTVSMWSECKFTSFQNENQLFINGWN